MQLNSHKVPQILIKEMQHWPIILMAIYPARPHPALVFLGDIVYNGPMYTTNQTYMYTTEQKVMCGCCLLSRQSEANFFYRWQDLSLAATLPLFFQFLCKYLK